jgi:hypothetical protein
MSVALKTYDPQQYSMIVAGQIMDGYGDGTYITVARNEDGWMYKSGVDGSGARAKNSNRSGRITLTLLQTSDSNDILSALAAQDELTGGTAVFPILCRDGSGRSVFGGATCWIVKQPDSEFAKEVGTRQWVFETNRLDMFVGGN